MFGIIRPCGHQLGEELRRVWMSHLCGLCLTLRDIHGYSARAATNVDGILMSVLVAAQLGGAVPTRQAGRCPLRRMRRAEVVVSTAVGARLSAAVSLAVAATKAVDHAADSDGLFARPLVAGVAGHLANRATAAAARTAAGVGFDLAVLERAAERQFELERLHPPGALLLELTAPTEQAAAATFEHTTLLADHPSNAGPLAEAGRLFGRLTHLLDAVTDQADDDARGAYNPLTVTGTGVDHARAVCDDAVFGMRRALADVELADGPDARLLHVLLTRELGRAVERAFRSATTTDAAPAHRPGLAFPGYPATNYGFHENCTFGRHALSSGGRRRRDGPARRRKFRDECCDCCETGCDCCDCCS